MSNDKKRIIIEEWFQSSYSNDEGYYEIAHIKMRQTKSDLLRDLDIDELFAMIKNNIKQK